MPIKPKPMKLTCRQCGNSMIFAPRSDAFAMPDSELCGELQWQQVELNALDRLNPIILFQSLLK